MCIYGTSLKTWLYQEATEVQVNKQTNIFIPMLLQENKIKDACCS